MCRFNQLWGFALIAFGLGVLIGLWLEGGFFCGCFGVFMMILGLCVSKSRRG